MNLTSEEFNIILNCVETQFHSIDECKKYPGKTIQFARLENVLNKFYEFIMNNSEQLVPSKNSGIIEIVMYKIKHYEPIS